MGFEVWGLLFKVAALASGTLEDLGLGLGFTFSLSLGFELHGVLLRLPLHFPLRVP